MTSKECLEHICKNCDNKCCPYIHYEKSRCGFYGVIREDLERLEELEKENQKLKEIIKANFGYEKGFTYCDPVYFNYNAPVMEEEIKEVLEND